MLYPSVKTWKQLFNREVKEKALDTKGVWERESQYFQISVQAIFWDNEQWYKSYF